MEVSGRIEEMRQSLKAVHSSSDVLFFFISIGLTGFFEGVAGFGTPGAIVPPILIAMGYKPLVSVVTVLLFDGLFAAFGAVGTPLIAGMETPLKLSSVEIRNIGFYSSLLVVMVGIVFMFFIFSMYVKSHGAIRNKFIIMVLYTFFAIPFIFFSWFATDLCSILASLVMLVTSVFFLAKGKPKLKFKAWFPYLGLVVLLLLPKVIPFLNNALNHEISFENILGTDISPSIKPFKSPLFPFVIIGLSVLFLDRKRELNLKPIIEKTGSVFLVLFPIISVSQMMLNSGGGQDSMISIISHSFVWMNNFYSVISPFIGMLGSFITGSTTVSNIVFSASQLEIATRLHLNPEIILALQHSAAAIGNAICLFNIVAAASVAGIKEENKILSKTITPALLAAILIGIIGMLFIIS